MKKINKTTLIISLATIILAGVAIFTAIRLYQLRDEAVAPTAPESEPGAQTAPTVPPPSPPLSQPTACEDITFTIGVEEGEAQCQSITAYRNDTRNTAGNYFLTEEIASGETVEKDEIVVFEVTSTTPVTGLNVEYEGSLISNRLVFMDATEKVCEYGGSGIVPALTCTGVGLDKIVFRVRVADTAPDSIPVSFTVSAGSGNSTCSTTLALTEDVGGQSPTPTPTATPTPAGQTPTPPGQTPTPPGQTASPTGTPIGGGPTAPAGTSTPQASLPPAGYAIPTLVGLGAGIIILLFSIILAL